MTPPSPDDYIVPRETLERLGHGDLKAGRRVLRLLIDLECSHAPINGPTPRPENVRKATEADEDQIMVLLRRDFEENAQHIAEWSEREVANFVHSATRKGHSIDQPDATIAVIDVPHGLAGMVYLIPERWWWSDAWYVREALTYCPPEHRNQHNVAALLKYARSVVDGMSAQLGYRVLLIGSVVASRQAREKVALFGRLMNFAGGIYCYPDPSGPTSVLANSPCIAVAARR